jgi:pSer/pThr/pTyr-binding forkhead associated (FHA) protein
MEILLSISSKTDGSSREIKRDVGDGLVVGRGAEEGILLEGLDLSREHLVLTADDINIYVTDVSVNGTWLNGTRLRKSARNRVRAEDSIEIPGYVLNVRPAEQPVETGEVEVRQSPQAPVEDNQTAVAVSQKSGPLAMLAPVFQFVGSFTLMEKVLVVVGLCGLFLLGTYLGA